MSVKINHIQNYPIHTNNTLAKQQSSFKSLLENELTNSPKLKISKHAQARLTEREITLSDETWSQIEKKISEARRKGVQDSLVLVNEAALIINAKNNTVITAMDRDEARTQIFTNITGAIIMD
ncbi:TIGR02530 family flagellar biosynthesis protein [Bacillus weihaiensis]|uniref:TIGR02530 family flagellar biosynthesis protein n=1 Tax=Bacillus weihaiensis TaxID=1547283 RepID=UPI002357BC4D|nr:TIGR02530 family flagellar biosynthesis protein [Bacillus weihaiensis]